MPQALVAAYGIRAYYGVPLFVGDIVVGTLCVLDVRPRDFDDATRTALAALARVAAARLAALTVDQGPPPPAPDSPHAITSALAGVVAARIAALELGPRLRLAAGAPAGMASALAVLDDAGRAIEDLDHELSAVEQALRGLLAGSGA